MHIDVYDYDYVFTVLGLRSKRSRRGPEHTKTVVIDDTPIYMINMIFHTTCMCAHLAASFVPMIALTKLIRIVRSKFCTVMSSNEQAAPEIPALLTNKNSVPNMSSAILIAAAMSSSFLQYQPSNPVHICLHLWVSVMEELSWSYVTLMCHNFLLNTAISLEVTHVFQQ